ncbi:MULTISPECIES: glycosyltransferase family 2 protein [Alphaproteobacteria]|nr:MULTISPECIES: glycosyltransferase [Alphaproteobacteria]
MAKRAAASGTTLEAELLASGQVEEDAYYGALARLAGLAFLKEIPEGSVVDGPGLDSQLTRPCSLRLHDRNQPPLTVIAPEARRIDQLLSSLDRHECLRQSIAIASPTTIRQAAWRAGAERRVRATVRHLVEERPDHSAHRVLTAHQGFWAGSAATGSVALIAVAPTLTALWLHVALSLLYLAALALRLVALTYGRRARQANSPDPLAMIATEDALPVYTVMVALYREAEVVPQLLASLERLDWPRTRLDVKLVCEADDVETLASIRALTPQRHIEIIEVPPMMPRTKPKALSYALAGARGDYLTIFDAEDRPHPGQLREAYGAFCSAPADLACLQAPLIIANMHQSWTSALFALEYAALFRRMLPVLARFRMPLPLGGTSNHFRMGPLKEVGGWDPHNVTEGADLGMRLYRMGYRSATIRRQTLEDAPTTTRVWLGQRTRWFKGWLQTWLVIMRDPARTIDEMGLVAFATFQLLIGGMLVSALSHPLILVFLVSSCVAMLQKPAEAIGALETLLFAVDITNILGSYAAFVALGLTSVTTYERERIGRRWMGVPLYWMMTSYAAWKAVSELRYSPFFWNKTPHQPRQAGDATKMETPQACELCASGTAPP